MDEFLTEMAKYYEIVVYTASLNKYADPLLDLLDPNRVIRTRLFRESCVFYEGNYDKDRERHTESDRDTEKHRETSRDTERQTQRQRRITEKLSK